MRLAEPSVVRRLSGSPRKNADVVAWLSVASGAVAVSAGLSIEALRMIEMGLG